jgi:hypothetical protein
MRLIGKACVDGGFSKRRIGGQERSHSSHPGLCVIGVGCHPNSALEGAQQSERSEAGGDGEGLKSDFVRQVVIEIGPSASDCDGFRRVPGHATERPGMTL